MLELAGLSPRRDGGRSRLAEKPSVVVGEEGRLIAAVPPVTLVDGPEPIGEFLASDIAATKGGMVVFNEGIAACCRII